MKVKVVLLFLAFILFSAFNNAKAEMIIFTSPSNVLYQDLVSFLEANNYSYERRLTSDEDFLKDLTALKKETKRSEGMSKNFRYYPLIFINESAFSGFNKEVKKLIEENYGKK